jgi:hypothetical protein
MVSVLTSSAVDLGSFADPAKPKTIKLVFVALDKMIMMMSAFVLDQHAKLDFNCASSLKQQSACRHVASLGHIILIRSQPNLE